MWMLHINLVQVGWTPTPVGVRPLRDGRLDPLLDCAKVSTPSGRQGKIVAYIEFKQIQTAIELQNLSLLS